MMEKEIQILSMQLIQHLIQDQVCEYLILDAVQGFLALLLPGRKKLFLFKNFTFEYKIITNFAFFQMIIFRNSNCVHACDLDETMCKIARSCFLQNNARVKLFEMHSNKMTVIKRYNLLISETVDCAIFGERIVDTVIFVL